MATFNSSLPMLGRTEGMFRQELFSTFGDLQTVRLCNSANPGGDRGDDVYVFRMSGERWEGFGRKPRSAVMGLRNAD